MEQANSTNFTIAALLGSARPQQALIRDADVFHEGLYEAQRNHLHSLMGRDEEEDQESAQIPGNISVYSVVGSTNTHMKIALNNPGCLHVTLQKVALWRPVFITLET